jgi:hypothetical protein
MLILLHFQLQKILMFDIFGASLGKSLQKFQH